MKRQQHGFSWAAFRNVVVVLLLLSAAWSILLWRAPMWVLDRVTYTRLWFEGVHSEYAAVGGYRIHYLAGGAGPPLVLVHGLGSRATDWANLIPQFVKSGHRVYALDLLGYGLSEKPRDASYSIAQEAAIVEEFLDSRRLKRVDMAGWSMGGWIAMQVALAHPERIRRLVLLDSAGLRFQPDFDPALFAPGTPEQLAALERLLTPHPQAMPDFLAAAMIRRGRQSGWVVQRSLASMETGQDEEDGKLGALSIPVLIGWGREDRLIPLDMAYKLHAQIPQSTLSIYDNCGHLAPGQCASRVGPDIVRFLQAPPPGGS